MSKCEEKENKMGTLRNDKWRHVWPFFTIMLLHCVAILLFTRGFLLTRTELPHFSHCSDISKCPCFSSSSPSPLVGDTEVEEEDLTAATRRPDLNVANQSHQQTRCWTRPAVDRLIIIVLDALRSFLRSSFYFKAINHVDQAFPFSCHVGPELHLYSVLPLFLLPFGYFHVTFTILKLANHLAPYFPLYVTLIFSINHKP